MPSAPRPLVILVTHAGSGGAQKASRRLAQLLQTAGEPVEILYLYNEANSVAQHPRELLALRRPRSAYEYLKILYWLHRRLRELRPRAVFSFLPLANSAGQAMAWLAGVKWRIASQRSEPGRYSPAMRAADKIAGSWGIYQRNVCVSNALASSFRDYPRAYRRRIRVVHNAIEQSARAIEHDKNQARAALGLPPGFLLLALGRLVAEKNYQVLIDALAQAPKALLVFAGDGELRSALQEQAQSLRCESRVFMLGECDPMRVGLALRAADAFVQPSVSEGQSNALLEAMQAGLPIISSNIAAQSEVLQTADGDAAILLDPDAAEQWGKAIERLASDPAHGALLAARATRRLASFQPEAMRGGFCACLDELERARRRPLASGVMR